MSYPVLAPGTFVKPQVTDLRFHWLIVLSDPGPASNPRRIIKLQRTEPARADQYIKLRRDRVDVCTDVSRADDHVSATAQCFWHRLPQLH
jgi:hypothetical protein